MNQYSGIPYFVSQETGKDPFKIIIQTIGGIPVVVSNETERLFLTGSEDMGVFQLNPPGIFLFKNGDWNLIGTSGSASGGGGAIDLSNYTGSVDTTGSLAKLNYRDVLSDPESEGSSGIGIRIDSSSVKIGTTVNDYGDVYDSFGIFINKEDEYHGTVRVEGHTNINGNFSLGDVSLYDIFVQKNGGTEIGIGASVVGSKSISIGFNSLTSNNSLSFGYLTQASASNNIAIGNNIKNVDANSMLIGIKNGANLNTSPMYVGVHGNEYGDVQKTIYQSDESPIDSGTSMGVGSCPTGSISRKSALMRLNNSGDTLNIFVNVNGTVKKGTISLVDV